MKLTKEEYELLLKKLEYRFKKSGAELIQKLEKEEELLKEDVELLLKKLESNFKKSENAILGKLKKFLE